MATSIAADALPPNSAPSRTGPWPQVHLTRLGDPTSRSTLLAPPRRLGSPPVGLGSRRSPRGIETRLHTESVSTLEQARDEAVDVVVVGGGIAGLIAASRLSATKTVLLEAEDRIGGRVQSERRGEYWLNLGAQFAEGDGVFIEAMNRLGISRGSLDGTTAAFAWNGRVISSHSPARFVLQSRLGLAPRLDLARLGLRLQGAYKRLVTNKDRDDARRYRALLDGQPATEMASKVRTAEVRTIFDDWVRHWIGCDAEDTAATQFVIYMGSAMIKASDVPNFSLPVGGNQSLTDGLASELGARVRPGSRVLSVTRQSNVVEVTYEDGLGPATITARRCIVALTADRALDVLKDIEEPQRQALSSIRYGRYVLAGIFTNESGPQPWDNLYAIATPGMSFQVIYNHAAALRRIGPRRPGGAIVCYAGGSKARALWDMSDGEVASLYHRDLAKLYPVLDRSIQETIIHRVPKSVPYWAPGDRSGMRLLREPMGPIMFAGDYLGVPSMTAAAHAGDTAARMVLNQLDRTGT